MIAAHDLLFLPENDCVEFFGISDWRTTAIVMPAPMTIRVNAPPILLEDASRLMVLNTHIGFT
jgi:hypothetical protein